MKNLLLILVFLLGCENLLGQINHGCQSAKLIIVSDSACTNDTYSFQSNYVTHNLADTIFPSYFNNYKLLPKRSKWYKFVAPCKNIGVIFRIFDQSIVQIFKGGCNNLLLISNYSSFYKTGFFSAILTTAESRATLPVENLEIGDSIFVQISSPSNQASNSDICPFRLPELATTIHSKIINGNWSSKSTWIEDRLPSCIDSVVISEGAVITHNLANDYLAGFSLKSLRIGGPGNGIAKLIMNPSAKNIQIFGDLYIGKNDTLLGGQNAITADRFILSGDLINHGTFSYFKKGIQTSFTAKPVLWFKSINQQRVYGTGNFLGSGIPELFIDNPNGVKWEISGYSRAQIFLNRGEFNNNLSTIEFNYDNSIINDASFFGINICRGTMISNISGLNLSSLELPMPSYHFCYLVDDSLETNKNILWQSVTPNSENSKYLTVNKWGKRKIEFIKSEIFRKLELGNGILSGGPTDTLSFETCSFGNRVSRIRHSTFGYHRNLWQQSSTPANWDVPAWAGGKGRSHSLTKYNVNAPNGQWLLSHVWNQPPSGTLLSPGTILLGPHVLEIKSNLPLGDSTRLQMEVYHTDSLFGLAENWRIAQAPSLSGPWTPLHTRLQNISSDSLVSAVLSTSMPIKLSNGNFFSIVTVGQAIDVSLSRVLPVSTFRFGCPENEEDTIRIIVRNNGFFSVQTISVGAKINGQIFQNLYTNGQNWFTGPLLPGKVDTLSFRMAANISGLLPIKYFVWAPGDNTPSNDTLFQTLQTNPATVPYRQTFDTCLFTLSGNGYSPLLKYGHPIVEGWDNWFTGPYYYLAPMNTASFFPVRTATTNPNKVFLVSVLGFIKNGNGRFTTQNFGPIGSHTWLNYQLDVCDFNTGNEFRVGDTLWIEASNDCGKTYTELQQINQDNNFTFFAPTGTLDCSQTTKPPISQRWDSIPFPPGTKFHVRFRIKTRLPLNNNGEVRLDNFRVVDTLFTDTKPLINQPPKGVFLYPNPSSDKVQVSGVSGPFRFHLFDNQGRMVLNQWIEERKEISISQYPLGLYFWRIVSAKGPFCGKWVRE